MITSRWSSAVAGEEQEERGWRKERLAAVSPFSLLPSGVDKQLDVCPVRFLAGAITTRARNRNRALGRLLSELGSVSSEPARPAGTKRLVTWSTATGRTPQAEDKAPAIASLAYALLVKLVRDCAGDFIPAILSRAHRTDRQVSGVWRSF